MIHVRDEIVKAFWNSDVPALEALFVEWDIRRVPEDASLKPLTWHLNTEHIVPFLTFLASRGLRLAQAIANQRGDPTSFTRAGFFNQTYEEYKYLWANPSLRFSVADYRTITNALIDSGPSLDVLQFHLTQPQATSLFLQLSTEEKVDLVKLLFNLHNRSDEIQSLLSRQYYAPYLLVQLIEKSTYLKQRGHFAACLANSTAFELEVLSSLPDLEERFVKFLKHIEILDAADPAKVEGQKLIQVIFSIERFKAYQNVSLQLFDHESMVHEEEEPNTRRQTQAPHARGAVVSEEALFAFVRDSSRQQEAIEYLRANRTFDVLCFRPPQTTPGRIETYYVDEESGRVHHVEVDLKSMNLLQLAVILGREPLARYLLTEHTYIMASTREVKSLDPRIILAPLDGHSNDLATVTLALQTQSRSMISLVWDSYPDIFTAQHAVKFAKLAMHFSLGFTEQLLAKYEVYSRLREGADEPEETEPIPRVYSAIKANDQQALSDVLCEFYKY